MTRWRTRHRGSHAERGAAAVEFAIVLVVLLLVIFAIIDFGRLLFVSQSIQSASREGARSAVVGGDYFTAATNSGNAAVGFSANSGFVCQFVISDASGVFPPNPIDWATTGTDCNDAVNPCDDPSNPQSIRVRTEVTFSWLTPVGALPGYVVPSLQDDRPVSGVTTMRCE